MHNIDDQNLLKGKKNAKIFLKLRHANDLKTLCYLKVWKG